MAFTNHDLSDGFLSLNLAPDFSTCFLAASFLPSVFSTRPPSIPHSSPLLMLLTPPTTFAPRRRSTETILSSSPSCCSVFDKIGRSKEGRVGVPSYIFLSEIRPRSHLCRCWPSLIIKWQRFECMLCIAHSGLQSDASRLPHPHILGRACRLVEEGKGDGLRFHKWLFFFRAAPISRCHACIMPSSVCCKCARPLARVP